ncbi:hypothetical protein PR202_ga04334 [Eleusine coracana subsp. coracana]|uniref:Plant bHLH transcription factor ACT-like domain-containing protein n=1 Tax=Eleusine coracana subsp. coracana TaxID=191504 RepID=A0AAV5BPF4_ELECO|nr:hypothetical protein PR202_ga04334 [Eleusine coracana subsp. coracana]
MGRDKAMVSREQKRAILHEKLQGNNMSIIADASTYIKDLRQKIARLNQEIASAEDADNSPTAFDHLGLTVLEARASCSGSFRLEAVGGEAGDEGLINAYAVEQAVVQAIRNCP